VYRCLRLSARLGPTDQVDGRWEPVIPIPIRGSLRLTRRRPYDEPTTTHDNRAFGRARGVPAHLARRACHGEHSDTDSRRIGADSPYDPGDYRCVRYFNHEPQFRRPSVHGRQSSRGIPGDQPVRISDVDATVAHGSSTSICLELAREREGSSDPIPQYSQWLARRRHSVACTLSSRAPQGRSRLKEMGRASVSLSQANRRSPAEAAARVLAPHKSPGSAAPQLKSRVGIRIRPLPLAASASWVQEKSLTEAGGSSLPPRGTDIPPTAKKCLFDWPSRFSPRSGSLSTCTSWAGMTTPARAQAEGPPRASPKSPAPPHAAGSRSSDRSGETTSPRREAFATQKAAIVTLGSYSDGRVHRRQWLLGWPTPACSVDALARWC